MVNGAIPTKKKFNFLFQSNKLKFNLVRIIVLVWFYLLWLVFESLSGRGAQFCTGAPPSRKEHEGFFFGFLALRGCPKIRRRNLYSKLKFHKGPKLKCTQLIENLSLEKKLRANKTCL